MLDVRSANASLLRIYESAWPALQEIVRKTPKASGAHLVRISEAYAEAPVRLAIVGQQTAGWDATDSVTEQADRYAGSDVMDRKGHTAFWSAARELADAVVGHKDAPFLWTNLVSVDVARKRAPEEVRDTVREAVPPHGLLRHILEAADPQVVIFFTGPNRYYAYEMRQQFSGLALHEVEGYTPNALVRVAHPDLPAASFRSYHPTYLRRGKLWDNIAGIADAARAALDDSDDA